MQCGKHKLDGGIVKIEPGVPAVKLEVDDEQGAVKKARRTDEPRAKKPMPDIIRKGLFAAALKENCVDSIRRWCETYENFVDMAGSSDLCRSKRAFIWHVIRSDNLSVLKMLVDERGLDVNHFIVDGFSSFGLVTGATAYDSDRCLVFLHSKGATMEYVIKDGITLAHEAVRHSALKSLKFIASCLAHLIRVRDDLGFSAMDYASKKQGGHNDYAPKRDLDDKAMQCVLILAEHIDEKDAETALHPFSKLYKDSSLLKKIKENFKFYPGYIPTYGVQKLLEFCMGKDGLQDVACFLIEANIKVESEGEKQKLYYDALKRGAPDSIIQMMEKSWFGA